MRQLSSRSLGLLAPIAFGTVAALWGCGGSGFPTMSPDLRASTPLTVLRDQGTTACVDLAGNTSNVNAVTLFAWGGAPISGYTWTVAPGSTLPPGISIDNPTGILKGNGGTMIPGNYSFDVEVTDDQGATDAKLVSLEIRGQQGCPYSIFQQGDNGGQAFELPPAIPGEYYGSSVYVDVGSGPAGAVLPLTWSLASGSLPTGLTLDAARGVIHGVPASTASGDYTFTTMITDHAGKHAFIGGNTALTYSLHVQ